MSALLLATAFIYAMVLTMISWGTARLDRPSREAPARNTSFSILIPFRNEAAHLPALITDLLALSYPRLQFEVLFLDDGSQDESVKVIRKLLEESELDWQLIDTTIAGSTGKKHALLQGISRAQHPWILTSDADVRLPSNWLRSFDALAGKNGLKLICGPVAQFSGKRWIEGFQWLDHLSLQAVTRGLFGWKRPLFANGANMCYSKDLFETVGGFEGNMQHPSGDDLFLLEKVRLYDSKSIGYINDPEAAVTTYPLTDWPSLVQQRVRWVGKARYQRSKGIKVLGFLVVWTNLLLLAYPLLGWLDPALWGPILVGFILKIVTDAFVIFQSGVFFSSRPRLHRFLGASLFYPVFSLWVFFAGLGGRFQWKGRQLKH